MAGPFCGEVLCQGHYQTSPDQPVKLLLAKISEQLLPRFVHYHESVRGKKIGELQLYSKTHVCVVFLCLSFCLATSALLTR